MRATFAGFSTAQFALSTAQNSLNVVGQNISNINTIGYTKQNADQISLNLTNPDNKYNIGFGSQTQSISQSRDPYLDLRFRTEIAKVGEADVVNSTLYELEDIFDEIAKIGIQEGLTDLMSALQDLSLNISSDEFQEMVKGSCDSLMQLINQYSNQLDSVRNDATDSLENVDIPNVNDILADIAALNASIEKSELIGSSALELRDQRNLLLDELASYMDIDIRYVDTEVQPGVSIDRLNITLSQKSYEDDGTVTTNTLTILNGAYAGTFNLVTDDDGKHGITFTSAIGEALNDSEGINKLNTALTNLSNVNEQLAQIADELAELDSAYQSSTTSYERNALQTKISELAQSRADYIGMRDNFLNTIEAMVDIDYEVNPDNATVEVTFTPSQVMVYDSVSVDSLTTDSDAIGELQFSISADGVLSFGTTEIGLINVTDDELAVLNTLMSNFTALYEQLDSIYAELNALTDETVDIDGNYAEGTIPYAQAVLDAAIQNIINTTDAVNYAQADLDEAEDALTAHNKALTTKLSEIATYEQEIADLDDTYINYATELAELEAKIVTAQAEYDALALDTTALEDAVTVAEEAVELATEIYQASGTARTEAQTALDALLLQQTNLLEEQVGLLEQRDSFLTTMGLILDLDYSVNEDEESADYGKLTSLTFKTASLDPDTEPDTYTLVTYPELNGDTYESTTLSFYLEGLSNSIMLNTSTTGGVEGLNIQSSLTSDVLLFNAGSFKGSLDVLNCTGEDGDLRGIGYYEKQLDELVITFADMMNDINTNKAAGYNVGDTDANGYALFPVTDASGNPYYSLVDADGKPLIYDSTTMTSLDASIIVDADGNMYTSNETYSYGDYSVSTDSSQLTSIEKTFDSANYLLGGTVAGTPATVLIDEVPLNRTGIPQYNDDGTPLLDDKGNHIYHDEALQLDADGNNVGNNFLFTYDPSDPSGTISVAREWVIGDYKITTSIVDGSASGANDNILNMINALTADHTFVTTTSEPPFTSGDTVSKFEGSFYDYFSNMCTTLGLDIKTTSSTLANSVTLVSDIADSRNAVSGVNIDEEGISLIQYQKAYTAAARLMTTLDEALETLLNMGKVGR